MSDAISGIQVPAAPGDAIATRQDGVAVWLVVTAPGMLLTRSLGMLALIGVAWWYELSRDPYRLAAVGAAYLATQAIGTLWLVRRPGRVSIALCSGLVAIDAAIAGLLLGAGLAWSAPGGALAVVAIGLGFAAIGRRGVLLSGCVSVAVAAALAWSGFTSASPAHEAPPVLSVERSFAGIRVESGEGSSFAGALSVETSFAGTPVLTAAVRRLSPVLSVERSYNGVMAEARAPIALSELLLFSFLAAALALVAGNLLSLVRSHRAQTDVAHALVAAGRLAF
jgi:hypothetical protein